MISKRLLFMHFNNSVLMLDSVGLSDIVWLWLSVFPLLSLQSEIYNTN